MIEPQEETQVQDDTASRINAFKKARENEQDDFDVYVYRVIQDNSKKIHHPFLTKYNNYLPDEAEIAEKFRGGRYKLQAIWYQGKVQKSQSWSYEIDESTFPAQSSISTLPISNNPGDVTQNMMLIVADIMKTAYAVRPGTENEVSRRDPLEMFTEVQGKMSEMYNGMLDIQQNVMQRAFQNNLEKKYGLIGGTAEEQNTDDEEERTGGIMQSGVIEIVRQIVDGAKLVLPLLGIPGAQPVIDSIKKNPEFSKYAELAKNPVIVKEVAQALRKEYGDKKAGLLLKSFGISMVARPGIAVSAAVPAPAAEIIPAGASKVRPGSKKPVISKVKKG
jgi:hypothetical protein